MNDKMQQVLTDLANKLGVAVPYLWSVLVKQVRIEAAFDGFGCLLAACIFFFVGRVVHSAIGIDDGYDCDRGLKQSAMWSLVVIGVAILAIWISTEGAALIYPEGAALRILVRR